jgi:hypothetical protein
MKRVLRSKVTFYQIPPQETTMVGYRTLALLIAGLPLAGCTSDPNAPVNQTFPIRQMDRVFDSLSTPEPTGPDYTRAPGYAPAYPPYGDEQE